MTATVKPADKLRGVVILPASKSYSIRALIIAACGGTSRITAPSDCDDARVALTIARNLGATISRRKNNEWMVRAGRQKADLRDIDVHESGTVLRFLLPLVSLYSRKARITGRGTLRGRPNFHLMRTLRAHGLDIRGRGREESIPIHFAGGRLSGGTISIEAGLSSQFISALFLACPQLPEETRVVLQGKSVVSADYLTMTRQVLARSGIRVQKITSRTYRIKGNQKYQGFKNFLVPSDYGLAAFLLGAGALLPSRLELRGCFDKGLVQADGRILDFLRRMGMRFSQTGRAIRIRGPFRLRGGDFCLKSCPDLVPIMAVLALFAAGRTRLHGIRHARAKESDRISDLRRELVKIGARLTEKNDELVIYPGREYRRDVLLDPHRDHRLAMAFCVLGLKLGLRIKDTDCMAKSYPGFIRDIRRIGGVVRVRR